MKQSRFKLRFVLAVSFVAMSMLIALVMSLSLDRMATHAVKEDEQTVLLELTRALSERLDEGMYGWIRQVETLSNMPQLHDARDDTIENHRLFSRLQRSYSEISWAGFASAEGKVLVSADGSLEGSDVSARPWFSNGRDAPYTGDAHDDSKAMKPLSVGHSTEYLRHIDIAAPVFGRDGRLRGVVGAQVSWRWVRQLADRVFSAALRDRGINVFIASHDGHLLLAQGGAEDIALPVDWLLARNRPDGAVVRWPDGTDYVTTVSDTKGYGDYAGFGWIVVARQSTHAAYAHARQLQWAVLIVGAGCALLFAIFGLFLATILSRPLTELTKASERLRDEGEAVAIPVGGIYCEAYELGESLRKLLRRLVQERSKLAELNASQELVVQERTAMLNTANRHLFEALEERSRLVERLEMLASTDSMTGLLNRRALFERAEVELRRLDRTGGVMSVIILDIDYFKRINDGYGHDAGDEAIRQIAKALSRALRAVDVASRFGGEEFVLLLPETDMDGALLIAERLRNSIREIKVVTPSGPIAITASFGLAQWQAGLTIETVISRADEALYGAKYSGRDRVLAWSPS